MDLATATARLQQMVAYDQAPTLTSAQITTLLGMFRTPDTNKHPFYDTWAAATVYALNSYRVPVVNNGHIYVVTTAGTSGATEPTWPTTSGATVADGTVTWQERGDYLWTPTYNLRAAAAEGWRWKQSKLADQFDAETGGGTNFKRSQQWDFCERKIKQYSGSSSGIGSVGLVR